MQPIIQNRPLKEAMKHFAAAFALLLPTAVMAQPYLAGQVGTSNLQDTDAKAFDGRELHVTFERGYSFAVRSGYDFGQFRIEGELRRSTNDLDSIEVKRLPLKTVGTSGNVTSTTFLVNGVYAFNPGRFIQPYIGAGIGLSYIRLNDAEYVGKSRQSRVNARIEGYGLVLAYQFMLGLDFNITTNTALYTEYHYFIATTPQFENSRGAAIDLNYESSNVSVGVRYTF